MRLVFAGTPEFSVRALDALHAAGHQIVGVYTQPDRPAGRGRKLTPSPVAARAQALGLPLYQPEKLRGNAAALEQLRALAPELMVVVAYGLILPQGVLNVPLRGCLNIHASLLPRWRGAAPIQRAIEAGDEETGITIMQMDAGLDTGPMLLRAATPIHPATTAAQLHDTLAALGAGLIVEALARLQADTLPATPQPADGASYAAKLSKDEARIDWSQPATTIARRIRAFNPTPVAWSILGDERVRLWLAYPANDHSGAAPGTIVAASAESLRVAAGSGCVDLLLLQWPGGKPMSAAEAARMHKLAGQRFE